MGRNAALDKEEEDGEKEEDEEEQEGRPRLKFHPETTSTRCIPPMTTVFNSAFREWSNAEKKTITIVSPCNQSANQPPSPFYVPTIVAVRMARSPSVSKWPSST